MRKWNFRNIMLAEKISCQHSGVKSYNLQWRRKRRIVKLLLPIWIERIYFHYFIKFRFDQRKEKLYVQRLRMLVSYWNCFKWQKSIGLCSLSFRILRVWSDNKNKEFYCPDCKYPFGRRWRLKRSFSKGFVSSFHSRSLSTPTIRGVEGGLRVKAIEKLVPVVAPTRHGVV